MKLEKINCNSAVVFGAFFLIMSLINGIVTLIASVYQDFQINAVETFITTPIVSGAVMYVFALAGIVIYNLVARKFPISWTVKK